MQVSIRKLWVNKLKSMLTHLHVSNYAIIDEVTIDFSDGLSIITGETGAGKSILLGALQLVMGQRADASAIKDVSKKCIVEATFNIKKYNLNDFFKVNELDYEDETVVRREIVANGKSRVFINDTPVSLNQLKELSVSLIDIHSQHEALTLNEQKYQLAMIDAFADNDKLLAEFSVKYYSLKLIEQELSEIKEKEAQSSANLDYFRFLYNELDELALKSGEKEELESEMAVSTNSEDIKRQLLKVQSILTDGDVNVIALLSEARSALTTISTIDNSLQELYKRIDSSVIELKDIAHETVDFESSIHFDPQRIVELTERIDKIYSLEKKHRVEGTEALLLVFEDLQQKIDETESLGDSILQIEKEIEFKLAELTVLANKLSENRKKAGLKFEKEIEQILIELSLKDAQFKVQFTDLTALNVYGKDKIDFMFSANKGVDVAPIAKCASGGELSRLLLAVKHCISNKINLPTIIFDEIDTGVSGAVAEKVALLMKQMSKQMQVITITHLPQTASKADNHYLVYKETQKNMTRSIIKKLNSDERIVEIAKMLSGNNISDAAMANAKQLLS